MRKKIAWVCMGVIFFFPALAQNNTKITRKLKVFVDCSSTWCDMNFIRSEINLVDFMLDRMAADVHVLVTEQGTGSGGSEYQLIFFGQNRFEYLQDTLHFNTDPNLTDFERRDMLIKYLKLGLIPFVTKTDAIKDINISFKKNEAGAAKKDSAAKNVKDPWNYWVIRVGGNGNINTDAVYKDKRFGGNMSANRTTDDLKVNFSIYANTNKSTFEYEDSGVTQKIIVKNQDYGFWHYLIKSINSHWSYGYEINYNQNSFQNLKGQLFSRIAFEYDIFPYKEVNNRYFTISYGITVRHNHYYDTTLFNKIQETLPGHRADATVSFNQKWGSASVGITYQSFFHDWKLFNLGANAFINARITGGLSFNIYFYGALTRDQINLPKGGATEQEILTRRRQIASGYNISTSLGLSYRFGSKVNNFVNPRFEGRSN